MTTLERPDVLVERIRGPLPKDRNGNVDSVKLSLWALEAADRIGVLTTELHEEARLNGMGAERELALLARAERAEREREKQRKKAAEANIRRELAEAQVIGLRQSRDEARALNSTLTAELAAARSQVREMREKAAGVAEAQPLYPDTHTGTRQAWVKQEIAAAIRALPIEEAEEAGR